ncbi:MAG: YebC/PmpR family DNA-binding transcriptional regulator [Candidatus Paceibacterota bacterium]|jgi:YebC/PmpR family DNA-binding regulatory protein
MSGHNKWSKIKHKKGAEDAKKSKLYSVLVRQITMEVKQANGDANSPRVRTLIDKARAANMPNENIERAIKKAQGAGAENYTEILFEGYGPGGVALMIEGITDSKNRANAEIKHAMETFGGSLGTPGSASWAFMKGPEGWLANSPLPINDADAEKLGELIDALEELEDVKTVYHGALE